MADIMYHFKSTIDGNPPPSNVQACDSSKFLSHGEFKQRVIDLVNHERNKAGLGPLVNNCYLEKTAQGHSDDMMNRDYFDHNTPEGVSPEQRIDQSGYLTSYYECLCSKSQTTGENIAVGQTNPEEVVDTWMNSPPHRANILNTTFSEIGIGITDVPKSNKEYEGYYWVQNFGDIQLNE
ncbi:MAG: CAP domain-containing protein [Candidatus Gracilibacteria bacterium]|nr:CAP domain-containing protein [Candidatus Gracilibacteria bacterium]